MRSTDSSDFFTEACPFLNRHQYVCLAKGTAKPVGEKPTRHDCTGDNADSCPLFLSYLLRHSQPLSRYSRQHELHSK